ncbi:MAG TPA: hypothetical protein DCY27_01725 [Desulfobacterales bacterium]|nr:hypothetical protein [Desulfobacterales bacterium]
MHLSLFGDQTSTRSNRLLALITLCLAVFGGSLTTNATQTITLPQQIIGPGEATLKIELQLPPNCKLNQEAPSTVAIHSEDKKIVGLTQSLGQKLPAANLPITLSAPAAPGRTALQAEFRLNFCDDKIGLCFFKETLLILPVEVSKTSVNKQLSLKLIVKNE